MEGGRIFFGLRQGGGVFLDAETYKPPAPQPVNSEPSLYPNGLFIIFEGATFLAGRRCGGYIIFKAAKKWWYVIIDISSWNIQYIPKLSEN